MHASLSVIVPCYKEHDVIGKTLLTIGNFIRERFSEYEIIVITDGSPDGTGNEIDYFRTTHPEISLQHIAFQKNRGKGAAVRAGFMAARSELVLMVDADLTIDIAELDAFLEAIKRADIVIASRLVPGTVFEERVPIHRVLTARVFHLLQIIILGNFEFSDTQCGFKLFHRNSVLPLFEILTIERFAFDAELLFLASKMNLRVITLPIQIHKDTRNTNVRIIRDSLNMFMALVKIRWNESIGHYDHLIR